jgi:hypothetical protein
MSDTNRVIEELANANANFQAAVDELYARLKRSS